MLRVVLFKWLHNYFAIMLYVVYQVKHLGLVEQKRKLNMDFVIEAHQQLYAKDSNIYTYSPDIHNIILLQIVNSY